VADDDTEIALPDQRTVAGLRITGDSMYPRFRHGEVLLYDTRPVIPDKMIGETCVVQTEPDGDMLVKTIRRSKDPGRFSLESYSRPDMIEARLRAAYKIIGAFFDR
jgi:phage repressor protein C with HTH and peptisase S24 domain